MQNSEKLENSNIIDYDVTQPISTVLVLKASKELSANILDELNIKDPEIIPDEVKKVLKKS